MRSKFDEQLRLLNQEMMYMGTMIEDSIQKAIDALIDQNAELAKKIMNSDNDVDHEQKKIENICFKSADAAAASGKGSACDFRSYEDGDRYGANRRPCSGYFGDYKHACK